MMEFYQKVKNKTACILQLILVQIPRRKKKKKKRISFVSRSELDKVILYADCKEYRSIETLSNKDRNSYSLGHWPLFIS